MNDEGISIFIVFIIVIVCLVTMSATHSVTESTWEETCVKRGYAHWNVQTNGETVFVFNDAVATVTLQNK